MQASRLQRYGPRPTRWRQPPSLVPRPVTDHEVRMARWFCALKYLTAGLAVAAWAQMTAAPALALDTTTSAFPLQVSADGRHIVDHAGKAFRINADAAWFMSSQGDAPEVDEYLDNRKLKGFNT